MKANIPLIGKEHGRNRHNLTHQVSTTSDFCFCQPVMCNEVEPGSVNKFRIGQAVYAQPMVKPTFGRIDVKTYNTFVPIPEIWHAFESFLGQQSYHGSGSSYIPAGVPQVSLSTLVWFCRSFGTYEVYELVGDSAISQSSPLVTDTYLHAELARITAAGDLAAVTGSLVVQLDTYFNFPWYRSLFQAYGDALSTQTCRLGSFSSGTADSQTADLIGSCDWWFVFKFGQNNDRTGIMIGRYGTFGRNLLKILEGCGYAMSLTTQKRSILPLVAYYKAWFDLFMPARQKTWKDSNAFSLMEYVEQTGTYNLNDSSVLTRLLAFLQDLPKCYYTDNPDYASAHVLGTANDIAGSQSVNFINAANQTQQLSSGTGRDAKFVSLVANNVTQSALNLLKAVQRRINIRSVSGGRLDNILKSIFGQDYIDENKGNYIGSTSQMLTISEIMNHAETSEGYLGQYAGAASLKDGSQTFTYDNDGKNASFGYIVSLLVIVPRGRMSQGNDEQTNRLSPNDFYSRDYDSITMKPTAKSNIFGESDYGGYINSSNFDTQYDSGFGNIPFAFEYKFKKNILSGEFRMASTRANMLPFCLDKLLPFTQVSNHKSTADKNVVDIHNMSSSLLVASSDWRYLGLHPWLGQFYRIFVNSGDLDSTWDALAFGNAVYQYYDRVDDNFVVDLYIDYEKISPALPIADSWQTEAYGEHIKEDLA